MDEPFRQTDEEFWAEQDPYGDRFATRVPLKVFFLAAAAMALVGYLLSIR